MSSHRTARRVLLAATLAATLTLPAVQTAQALTGPATPAAAGAPTPAAEPDPTAYDEVDHLGTAAARPGGVAPAPGGGALGTTPIPGALPAQVGRPAPTAAELSATATAGTATTAAGVPCTVDGMTGLGPDALAAFLTDPAVTFDGCLKNLLWTWDARYATTMDDAHVKAVADRIVQQVATDDGTGSAHLYELWTFLHATIYYDWDHSEIDTTDAATLAAIQRAVDAHLAGPHALDDSETAGLAMREMAVTATAPGLRQNSLAVVKKVLGKLGPGTTVADSWGWGGAALSALVINYLGVNNSDQPFMAAVAADPAYRAALRSFSTAGHLKGTRNEWVARDAMAEYGRLGQIPSLRDGVTAEIGSLLDATRTTFGEYSAPWVKVVGWANHYGVCDRYGVCTAQIEAKLFPNTYTYDNGAIEVHTALDRATVDQMYYASKQVKTHFLRVLGTDAPLAGDTNATLHIHLYATRSDYEVYHPLLTGMSTNNGGIYIENGATFYTYQRTSAESYLTLEELFRHEYVHYLNGRWAVPGYFGDSRWYSGDRTTAMDEGTAEFFDGSTRDQGVLVRKSLVRKLAQDEAAGIPRMTVSQILHASYNDSPAFHFYNYAGTFFEFLWQKHPSLLREMYGYQRADDPAGFDAWRNRLGADGALNAEYGAFLDAQIALTDSLYVPSTSFIPNGWLDQAYPAEVQAAFAKATSNTPACKDNGDWDNKPMRFVCTGRITANLADSGNPDRVFKDMSSTVDYFILTRTKNVAGANNLNDMNCSFGKVDVWPSGQAGTADYTCEGPLRR